MKANVALPILLSCASLMLSGLGIAAAQDQPGETPRPNVPAPPTPRLAPPNKVLPGGLPRRAPGLPGNQGGPPAPGNPAGGETGTTPATPGSPGSDDEDDFEPMPPGARVTFNLEDAELTDLVRLVSQITGKRFIITGKARSLKASVFAPTKVTAAEAYRAFLSILDLNGMTVVPTGRYLKIVDTQGIEGEPIATYTGGSPTPGGDRYMTRLHRIENVSADDVRTLLERFKTDSASIVAYAPTNTLIITETGTNLQRMLRLIEAIDVPRTGEQVWIEPIHYANAAEIAARLTEIYPVGESSGGSASSGNTDSRPRPPRASPAAPQAPGNAASAGGTVGSRSGESRVTKILPDERTNSLIILATERAYLRILELIRQLDVPLEGEGRVHVHAVQHGDAEDLANTLSSIITGRASSSGGGQPGGARAPGAQAGAAAGGGGGDGGIFEGQIRVTAHKATNSLVVTSSLHDYAALRSVIEQLDARRRQVFIEAVIMELSVTRGMNLGISFHGGVPEFPTDDSLTLLGSNAGRSLNPVSADALTGLALGVRGPDIEESRQLVGFSVPAFGVALNAIANSGDTNILSTPHLIAMDNEEAEITVGGNVPLQTSGLGGGSSGLSGLAGLAGQAGAGAAGLAGLAGLAGGFGQVPRADVGTTLRITPHINESDEVRLDIEEEISEAEAATEGTLGVRSISKRAARTKLVVRDAQTVVIGGLMRDTVTSSESKIPILGDIPLLGVLFRQTTHQTEKRNLLLFLTPYIIRTPDDLRSVFERKMRERQEFIDRFFVFGDSDYEPPIDYSRTRGMVSEIVNTLDAIDEDIRLRAALENEPVPEHVPRPPVGAIVSTPGEGDGEGDVGEGDIVVDESGITEGEAQPITSPTIEVNPPIEAPPEPTEPPVQ